MIEIKETNMKKKRTTKKLVTLALFVAMSLIMFLIESQFPPLFVPGAKMGLSNLFSLLALLWYGPVEAFAVIVARTLLGALFSNPFALVYSFTAGIATILLSAFLYRFVFPRISVLAISVAGGVFHNLVQLVVYILFSETALLVFYAPYLALAGVLSGTIVGLTLLLIIKKIPLSVYRRILE
ncbi:MAG: Gx transporter family protein [Clostridia bacterium]|nr:Gx transporter family protein [Clostridia bacterium]